MTLALRPYQIEGAKFLASRRFALLADEVRVGKTPQAILAAEKIGAKRVLVVCPAIAVPQWAQEFRRWSELLPSDILSYDHARTRDFSEYPRYDVAIIDECQYAKTPDALRTKAVFGKNGIGWHSDRMWCLSGTPMPNHPGELWVMLHAFGVTDLSYSAFCQRYCTYDWTGTRISGARQSRIPELKGLLAQIMLRRTRKQVAPEMPDIAFEFLAIDPVSQVDLPRGTELFVESGSVNVDNESRREVALAKALPLVEEITECIKCGTYRQTVVFAWHRDAIETIRAGLEVRGITTAVLIGGQPETQRMDVRRRFLEGKIQVVAAQIVAAGTAIDLSAASHGYFLELSWVGADNLQAANRLVSLMKPEPVTFDVCSRLDSVDDRVQRVLVRKMRDIRAAGLA